MKQGELFGPDLPRTPATPAAAAPTTAAPPPEELRRHLQANLGLWIDPRTAEYLARCLERGESEIEFIAADARSGRSAFYVRPAGVLRGV